MEGGFEPPVFLDEWLDLFEALLDVLFCFVDEVGHVADGTGVCMDLATDKTVRAALRQFKVKGGGGVGGKRKKREPAEDEPGFDCRKHGNRKCGPKRKAYPDRDNPMVPYPRA